MQQFFQTGGLDWPHYLAALVLVMVRISGIMVFAPVFSSAAIPKQMKALFVLAVSVLLAPVVAGLPLAHAEIGVLPILGELAVGMIFGLTLSMLNEVVLFAGQVIGVQFSFSLVNLLDPNSSIQTPLMGQMFSLFVTLTLLATGLHRILLAAVIRSFATAPVGTVMLDGHAGVAMLNLFSGVFLAALQLAAPVLASTMLADTALALMGRLSPQLPVMALTVPAKTILGYIVLLGSLALWPAFFEARFSSLLNVAQGLVVHAVVHG